MYIINNKYYCGDFNGRLLNFFLLIVLSCNMKNKK